MAQRENGSDSKRLKLALEGTASVSVHSLQQQGPDVVEVLNVPRTNAQKNFELINRVDFAKLEKIISSQDVADEADASKDDEADNAAGISQERLEWMKMQEQIRLANIQVDTLTDVLSILLKSKYLQASRVARKIQVPPGHHEALQKWQIYTAGLVGSRLHSSVKDLERGGIISRRICDELKVLALRWKLRISGAAIICDLCHSSLDSQKREGLGHSEVEVLETVQGTCQTGQDAFLKVETPPFFNCLKCSIVDQAADYPSYERRPFVSEDLEDHSVQGDSHQILRKASMSVFVNELFECCARESVNWTKGLSKVVDNTMEVDLGEGTFMRLELHMGEKINESRREGNATCRSRADQIQAVTSLGIHLALRKFQRELNNNSRPITSRRNCADTIKQTSRTDRPCRTNILPIMTSITTAEQTRKAVVSSIRRVSSSLKHSCRFTRLLSHWDSSALPIAPKCELHIISLDRRCVPPLERKLDRMTIYLDIRERFFRLTPVKLVSDVDINLDWQVYNCDAFIILLEMQITKYRTQTKI